MTLIETTLGRGAAFNGGALEQLATAAAESQRFQEKIDRLCAEAARLHPRSNCRRISEHDWLALTTDPRFRAKAVNRYVTSCETLADRYFLGWLTVAGRIHRLVCERLDGSVGYRVDVSGIACSVSVWSGPVASQIHAHLTGNASFRAGATAQGQAAYRQKPLIADDFRAALETMLAALDGRSALSNEQAAWAFLLRRLENR